ncbi:hypothetical protein ACOMHN_035291 [Nucella lapillus]
MDKVKHTRTYERFSLKFRNQQSKQLSDLFDRVTQDVTDKDTHMLLKCNTKPTGQDGNRRVKKMDLVKAVTTTTRKEKEEMMESSPEGVGGDGPSHSPCPLFESLCGDESHPKKSRPAVSRPGVKGSKRGGKKSGLYRKFQKALSRCSATPRPPTPVAALPEYPSIENFRDLKKQSFNWSYVHKEADSSCSQWLESLTASFSEKTLMQSGGKRTGRPSLPHRPATPATIRPLSFIKIRTPLPLSPVKMPESEYSEGETDGESGREKETEDDGSSSYTTVYTWTTDTNTATATHTARTGGHAGTGEGEGGEEMGDRSPTLELKPPAQSPLQSTAIHPHHEPPRTTPNVSPIKPDPDDRETHRTPSAPTHDVSPRGPRKTQSFLSIRGRAGPPKCSTMLFASPMADAGDAPLDVSSIRTALSEAIDLNEDAHKDKERLKNREGPPEGIGDRVLTSTPCGTQHSKKFKWNRSATRGAESFQWNLSSVQAPVDDEDLLAMDSSRETVNSDEIVADTLSESSIPGPDQQEWEAADKVENERVGERERMSHSGDAGVDQSKVESGVILTPPSQPDHTSNNENDNDDIVVLPSPLPSSSSSQHPPAAPLLSHSSSPPLPNSSSVRHLHHHHPGSVTQLQSGVQSVHISGKGDGLELDREKPQGILQYHDTPKSRKTVQRAADGNSSCRDEASTGQRCSVSVRKNLASQMEVCENEQQQGGRPAGGGGREADGVSPCPVSTTGLVGEKAGVTPGPPGGPPPPPKPSLLMWVEPVDSGFLDMVSNTPPVALCGPWNTCTTTYMALIGHHGHSGMIHNRNFDLDGRTLKMVTTAWYPFVIRHQNESSTWYTGLCMDLLDILVCGLNFTCTITEPSDHMWGTQLTNGAWTGLTGMLHRKEADFALSGLSVTAERAEVTDHTLGFFYDEIVLMATRPDPVRAIWTFFLHPFHWSVYLLLAGGLVVMTALWVLTEVWRERKLRRRVVSEDEGEDVSIQCSDVADAALILYGGPVVQQQVSGGGRALLCCWLLLAVVMAGTYTGKLTASALLVHPPLPFSSLSQLLAQRGGDYSWGLSRGTMMESVFSKSSIPDYKLYYQKMLEFARDDPDVMSSDFEGVIREKLLKENYAFVGPHSYYKTLRSRHCGLSVANERLFQDTLAIHLQKGSPYTPMFNKVLSRAKEQGLLDYLSRKWLNPRSSSYCQDQDEAQARVRSVTLDVVQTAFFLASGGAALSAVSLILECLFACWRRRS